MTNSDIIVKAYKKAELNGWKVKEYNHWSWFEIVFSHDFAKAFWGKKLIITDCFVTVEGCTDIKRFPNWKIHLQQMVLEKEPLKYIERFL